MEIKQEYFLFSGTGASRTAVNMKEFPSESLALSNGNPSYAAPERIFSQTNADYILKLPFESTLYVEHAFLAYMRFYIMRIIG